MAGYDTLSSYLSPHLGGLFLFVVEVWVCDLSFSNLCDWLILMDLLTLIVLVGVVVLGGGGATGIGVVIRGDLALVVLLFMALLLVVAEVVEVLLIPLRRGVGPTLLRCSSRPKLLGKTRRGYDPLVSFRAGESLCMRMVSEILFRLF